MEYFLSIHALGKHPILEIDEAQFNSLKNAKTALDAALAIEQRYDILISNYLDFENELLGILAEQTVRYQKGYSGLFQLQTETNRRIINLLTSTKLYIDQVKHHVEECSLAMEDLTTFLNAEYDAYFEYRFMEAMRNYTQHKGLPVHYSSIGMSSIEKEDGFAIEHGLQLYAQKSKLVGDPFVKKLVLKEMPEKVELTTAIRVYVSSINRIHVKIREAALDYIDSSRVLIDEYIEKYLELTSNPVGLYAYKVNSDYSTSPLNSNVLDKVLLTLKWDDIRLELKERNRKINKLEKGYVTGEVK